MKAGIFNVVVATSEVGVASDIFLKKASDSNRLFLSPAFAIGLLIYASTAFGWVIAMRFLKMATVGSVYSIATILLLALSGAVLFDERLNLSEWIGISLAFASLVMLSRHA